MTKLKPTLDNVSTVLKARVHRDLTAAAGSNGLLSKAEQAKAPEYLRKAADELRKSKPGARVTVSAMEQHISQKALALIGEVNETKGRGANLLSQAEAKEVARRDATLGFTVLEAYQVVSGKGPNSADTLAEKHVNNGLDTDQVFKVFASEAEAMRYHDPDDRSVVWLVRVDEGLLKNTYVSGRNDLWAQKFEIDKLSGELTVTGEH